MNREEKRREGVISSYVYVIMMETKEMYRKERRRDGRRKRKEKRGKQ